MHAALPRKRRTPLYPVRSLSLLILIAVAAGTLRVARAQDATGSLEGRLTDKNGAPVVNAPCN